LAVDAATQLIAAVDVVNIGSDMNQMVPMHAQLQHRYEITPAHWLADGGFTKLPAIEHLTEQGTLPMLPPPKSRNPASSMCEASRRPAPCCCGTRWPTTSCA